MKNFVIILVFCVTRSYSQDIETETVQPQVHSIKEICVSESGINDELGEIILETYKAERNAQVDCFMACLYKNVDLVDNNGKLIVKILRERLSANSIPSNEIEKVVESCQNITGDDLCNTAGNLFDCINQFQL